jgi:hypothetical protein
LDRYGGRRWRQRPVRSSAEPRDAPWQAAPNRSESARTRGIRMPLPGAAHGRTAGKYSDGLTADFLSRSVFQLHIARGSLVGRLHRRDPTAVARPYSSTAASAAPGWSHCLRALRRGVQRVGRRPRKGCRAPNRRAAPRNPRHRAQSGGTPSPATHSSGTAGASTPPQTCRASIFARGTPSAGLGRIRISTRAGDRADQGLSRAPHGRCRSISLASVQRPLLATARPPNGSTSRTLGSPGLPNGWHG